MSLFKVIAGTVTGLVVGYVATSFVKERIAAMDAAYICDEMEFNADGKLSTFKIKKVRTSEGGGVKLAKVQRFHVQWEGDVGIIANRGWDDLGQAFVEDIAWFKDQGYTLETVNDIVRVFKVA